MKIIGTTQIVRKYYVSNGPVCVNEEEFEIPVAFNVEELYKGTEEPDDPSECKINELVEVKEDTGPFRAGDMLLLTEDERHEIEEEELQNNF